MAWAPFALRLLRAAASRTADAARQKVAAAVRPITGALPKTPTTKYSPNTTTTHPIDHILRRFFSTVAKPKFQKQSIADKAYARGCRRRPFASPLRPNLTGGALPRTAGGYGLGSGARFFSHGPAAPAEVVQNVSQAMRAFLLNGKRAQYDGVNARGEKRWRAVTAAEDAVARAAVGTKVTAAGAYIDFRLAPTITAMSPVLAAALSEVKETSSLNTEGFLDLLAGDFERAARDLATILADLKRLSHLGDLPVSMEGPSVLRVRFPGTDAETVERLCEDAGLRRGYVGEDDGFCEQVGARMALRFPFASMGGDEQSILLSTGDGSTQSLTESDAFEEAFLDEFVARRWWSDPERSASSGPPVMTPDASWGEGSEGLYKFLGECERARGRF